MPSINIERYKTKTRVQMHSPPKESFMSKFSSSELTSIWITAIIVVGLIIAILGGLAITTP